MKVKITKSNKRLINSICKKLGLDANWENRPTNQPYDVVVISTYQPFAFAELIDMVKQIKMQTNRSRSIQVDLSEVETEIEKRKNDFFNRYSSTFAALKKENSSLV